MARSATKVEDRTVENVRLASPDARNRPVLLDTGPLNTRDRRRRGRAARGVLGVAIAAVLAAGAIAAGGWSIMTAASGSPRADGASPLWYTPPADVELPAQPVAPTRTLTPTSPGLADPVPLIKPKAVASTGPSHRPTPVRSASGGRRTSPNKGKGSPTSKPTTTKTSGGGHKGSGGDDAPGDDHSGSGNSGGSGKSGKDDKKSENSKEDSKKSEGSDDD